MNSLNPAIKFIFENVSFVANVFDVSCSIKNDPLIFDIYHKPTYSLSYLHYRNCHPQHTKNNIVVSLGQRITFIISENKEQYISQNTVWSPGGGPRLHNDQTFLTNIQK